MGRIDTFGQQNGSPAARTIAAFITGSTTPPTVGIFIALNKTLDEIRQVLEVLSHKKTEGKSSEATQQEILKRYAKDPWVRNFVEKFENEEIGENSLDAFKTIKNVLVVADDGQREIANELNDKFKECRVRIVSVNEINVDKKPDCIIALMAGIKRMEKMEI